VFCGTNGRNLYHMDNRTRILSLLGSVKRPGMDALIDYLQTSNFFSANCNGHHFIGKGGVAQHSLEVYDYMMSHNKLNLPEQSIILCALTHDLGKTSEARESFHGRRHDQRSLKVLGRCGITLSSDERTAILNHQPGHTYRATKFLTCPLFALLVKADCTSASEWQNEHPVEVAQRRARRAARRHSSRKTA